MQTPVQRGAFQTRNRLISGMAHGVLRRRRRKERRLITARYAVEQNREVFVFIGGMIRRCRVRRPAADGAVRVRTAEDISRAFPAGGRIRAEARGRPRSRWRARSGVSVVSLSDCAPEEPAAAPQAEPGFSPDAQRFRRASAARRSTLCDRGGNRDFPQALCWRRSQSLSSSGRFALIPVRGFTKSV